MLHNNIVKIMSGCLDKLRSYRVGEITLFDLLLTLIVAYFAAPYLGISKLSALLLAVPVGVLLHLLFGISTPLNTLLFEKKDCMYLSLVFGLASAGVYNVMNK